MHKFLKGKGLAILLTLAMMIVAVAVIVPIATAADPAEIQDFQYQTLSALNLASDDDTDLRFVFTIGKLDYTEVGFVVSKSNSTPTIGGANCYKAGTETVYSTITADDTPIPAPAGRFWVAVKLTDIPRSYFDGSLYVRAFVTDGEGTRYSDASAFTVCVAAGHLAHTIDELGQDMVGGTAAMNVVGTKVGHCDICNLDNVTQYGATTSLEYQKWAAGNSSSWIESRQFSKILAGGKHFYPDASNNYEGNDLYGEFSILWNETMLDFSGSAGGGARFETMFSDNKKNSTSYDNLKAIAYCSLTNDVNNSGSKIAGAFEFPCGQLSTSEPGNPYPNMNQDGQSYSAYPNLGGTDQLHPEWGWHRIGIKYHEDVTNLAAVESSGAAAQYKQTITIYIDGQVVSILSGTDFSYKLYTVEKVGDDLVYTDINGNYWFLLFKLVGFQAGVSDVYFIDGDFFVTCGQDFVYPVTRIDNPAARTEVVDGQNFNGAFYYTTVGSHDHVWGELVDDASHAADCAHAATQSIHCTVCGAVKPDSTVNLPIDPSLHAYGAYETVRLPSILGDGLERRTCANCSGTDDRVTEATEPTVKTYTTTTNTQYGEKMQFSTVLSGGKHFYPHASNNGQGNDLLIEYSFLWNDTLARLYDDDATGTNDVLETRICKSSDGSGDANDLVWMSLKNNTRGSDCAFAGGYEYGGLLTVEYGPANMSKTKAAGNSCPGNTFADFPNIGGDDEDHPEWGWHRVQIRYHQELTNEAAVKSGSAATYRLYVEVSIDGVLLFRNSNASSATYSDTNWNSKNLLFTVRKDAADGYTLVNGLYYKDIDTSRYIHGLRMPFVKTTAGTAYVVYGDYYCTAGQDFVMDVTRIDNPAARTETVGGDDLNGAFYYSYYNAHEHVWGSLVNDASASADCGTPATQSIHCTLCGAVKPDSTVNLPIDPSLHAYGAFETISVPTLLSDGLERRVCANCSGVDEQAIPYQHNVQIFTTSTNGSYDPYKATIGSIRGSKHFYTPGNDLLIEYSILWNESLTNLSTARAQYMDVRLTSGSGAGDYNKNIIYWSMADNVSGSDCAFAGGFEWGGIDKNKADNPYPKFTKDPTLGTNKNEYPNLGGANGGDGTPQGDQQWGWHRISIRYRNEVTNVDAVKGGAAATYNLEMWVYIDGTLVIHAYATDHKETKDAAGKQDRKLFSAACDGNGGITYTENDSLYLHSAYLNNMNMTSGKGYFEIGDFSVTVGSNFVQDVQKVTSPTPATLEVESGVYVPATMWYELKP
ncbi:MAG: hypothetical protein J6Z13_02145 [Clostridia bacterium]|nr:hypothetical protein [Clostridia bacterium]